MALNFAIIGKRGQLARALQNIVSTSHHQAIFLGRETLELSSNPKDIENTILDLPPTIDIIILAAAYTAVDKAETEADLAYAVNGQAPGAIARACKQRGIPLIHVSTDYVFKGNAKKPYKPEDLTDPINTYGASKLAGETEIFESQCSGAILRTSWVFDGQGQNFLNTMLRLAQTRTSLNVVSDQWGRPTYAGHLAFAIVKAAEKLCNEEQSLLKCYHVTGSGPITNWAEFAVKIFEHGAKLLPQKVSITPIPAKEYPTPAARPAYSVMDISLYENTFDFKLPTWELGLKAALAEKD